MKIAPSILSADFLNMQEDITNVEQAGAEYLHIDIMDGHFVSNLSFGPAAVQAIRPMTKMVLDCHLMVERPDEYIQQLAQAGADVIGVHVEATVHIQRTLALIRENGCKAEVVLNPGTPLNTLTELLPFIDAVLIMTVNPGFGGQKFISEMVDKVRRLAQIKKEQQLDFEIEVDGGINDATIKQCAAAGATVAVAGSFVFDGIDPRQKVELLKKLANDE
ncbi:ribulose-phosphate 3-epimerase [Liquorilactobacillus capillatus]|uniref:Ribulose-phosphate 3-epimerase n=1 Tax=Liquorilactobacillus capillatus DSM 19910 TaxID=1423731 RepID=A0A0R1LYE2_9LACO|nr:ribulose-phosphate 3-epimerase [Liquorilactobacillus capillatus]KRL00717.1 ribulose-phosphate 3-epimerase [Liquorilactobacillus capillatus DSM 19910]